MEEYNADMSLYVCQLGDSDVEMAKKQARAQSNGDTSDAKIKGNLGEIAFEKFCEEEISCSYEWKNRSAMEEGDAEYTPYDFRLVSTKVDVKTKTDITEFRPGTFAEKTGSSGDNKTDVYVFVLLNFNYDHATILGWASHHEIFDQRFTALTKTSEESSKVSPVLMRDIKELEVWT